MKGGVEGPCQLREAHLARPVHTQITDEGLSDLAALKDLTTSSLAWTAVTDEGLKELATLKKLTALDLDVTKTTSVREVVKLQNLTSLKLHRMQITDEALTLLRRENLLHALTRAKAAGGKRPARPEDVASLDLNGTQVTDAGLKELAWLKNLTALTLFGTKVSVGLKNLTGLKNLAFLNRRCRPCRRW